MGVGSNRAGDAIVVVNEQTSYQTWEFLYDPRIELLKQKGALQGGMQGGSGTSGQNGFGQPGFGQSGSGQSGFGDGTPNKPPTNPQTPQ